MATATRTRANYRFAVDSDRLVRAVAREAGFVTANGRGASKLPAEYAAAIPEFILPAADWRAQTGVEFEQKYHEHAGVPGVWTLEVRPSVKSGAPRFFVKCPGCGQEVPTGRLHQHIYSGSTCNNAFDDGTYANSVWYREDNGCALVINPGSRVYMAGDRWAFYDAAVERVWGGFEPTRVHTRYLMENAEPIHESEVPEDFRLELLDVLTR